MEATYDPTWVDAASGFVSRLPFVDPTVLALEMRAVFARSWLYLGHESEVSEAGQFVTRRLGDVPVILIRQSDGAISALMNSCRHRGAELCRSESGTIKRFVCPYHGWAFDSQGGLITTGFDQHLPSGTDLKSLSLIKVPRVESFHGLVFGCWDADVMPLRSYLSDIAWYLEAFFARTPRKMVCLAPPHRWRVRSNWKVGALNFAGDSQHIGMTHAGPLSLDPVRAARLGFTTAGENSFQVVSGQGHACTLTYLAEGMPEEAYRTHPVDLQSHYQTSLDGERLTLLTRLRVIVGTVFPNLSFIETQVGPSQKAVIVRLWQPLGVSETETLSWVFAEAESSDDYKRSVLRNGFKNFGAAGVFEQDDLELWASSTAASSNHLASAHPYSFHTAIPYMERPLAHFIWPGQAFKPADTEVAQLAFMQHWADVMRDGDASRQGA